MEKQLVDLMALVIRSQAIDDAQMERDHGVMSPVDTLWSAIRQLHGEATAERVYALAYESRFARVD